MRPHLAGSGGSRARWLQFARDARPPVCALNLFRIDQRDKGRSWELCMDRPLRAPWLRQQSEEAHTISERLQGILFHDRPPRRTVFPPQDEALRGTHNAEGAKVASGQAEGSYPMAERFDLTDLRLFLHVADASNITRGALRANMTSGFRQRANPRHGDRSWHAPSGEKAPRRRTDGGGNGAPSSCPSCHAAARAHARRT